MLRTANPALNNRVFLEAAPTQEVMTLSGTVHKSGLLLLMIIGSALFTWNPVEPEMGMRWLLPGLIGSVIAALVTIFKKKAAPFSAPVYAVCEGVLLGAISSVFERQFPGIVMQAVGLTFGTLGALLLAYQSGWIKPTENFKLGIVAATGGIALFYLISLVAGLFGLNLPLIHSSGPFGLIFSGVVVVIAALNLVLDFDFIEQGAEQGAPKYMEWYAAFGLMVTLVWLYLEILRLLSKLNSRR